MTEERDPRIRTVMVTIGESSPEAPTVEQLEELASAQTENALFQPMRGPNPWAPWGERKWPVMLLAATAVFVLVGGGAVLLRAVGSAAPVVTASTADPTTLQGLTPSLLTWSRLADEAGVLADDVRFTGGITDVAVGGPGLVAVGEGDDGAQVWTSVHGTTWTPVPSEEAVFGGPGRMSSITAGGPGLVAVGGTGDLEADGDGDAVVWSSVDGIVWSRVPNDESIFGGEGDQQMVSVTAGGPGLVAVGWDSSGGDLDAVVWTSVDGLTWRRAPHDESVFGGDGEQTMSSVTVGGPGLVAVGSDGFDDGVDRGQLGWWRRDFLGDAAVWVSVDGIVWSRVVSDDAVFGGGGNQWMDAVTSGGPGLVAVGGDWSDNAFASAAWTSADGTTWSRIPYDDSIFGGENYQAMNDVVSVGSGLVAVGRTWEPSGDDSAASVWISDDGITWSWLGYDEVVFGGMDNSMRLLSEGPVFTEYRQYMNSAVVTNQGVVGVGADWSNRSHGAAVWLAVPED